MSILESTLGVKVACLVGGCFGSLIAMSYLPTMNIWQRIGSYATGVCCSIYIPPLITYALSLPVYLDGPVAFATGIAGMGLVGTIITISRDPIGAFQRFRSSEGGVK